MRGAARPASATAINANPAYFFIMRPHRDYMTTKVSATLQRRHVEGSAARL
jgi:hypothetical protein